MKDVKMGVRDCMELEGRLDVALEILRNAAKTGIWSEVAVRSLDDIERVRETLDIKHLVNAEVNS